MGKLLESPLLLLILYCYFVPSSSYHINWLPLDKFDPTRLDPAGFEMLGNLTQPEPVYLVRVRMLDGILLGKFSQTLQASYFDSIVMEVGKPVVFPEDSGLQSLKTSKNLTVELFSAPDGSVSWVDATSLDMSHLGDILEVGTVPETKEIIHVCRIVRNGELYVGWFLINSGTCSVHFEKEEKDEEFNMFEILTVNYLGR